MRLLCLFILLSTFSFSHVKDLYGVRSFVQVDHRGWQQEIFLGSEIGPLILAKFTDKSPETIWQDLQIWSAGSNILFPDEVSIEKKEDGVRLTANGQWVEMPTWIQINWTMSPLSFVPQETLDQFLANTSAHNELFQEIQKDESQKLQDFLSLDAVEFSWKSPRSEVSQGQWFPNTPWLWENNSVAVVTALPVDKKDQISSVFIELGIVLICVCLVLGKKSVSVAVGSLLLVVIAAGLSFFVAPNLVYAQVIQTPSSEKAQEIVTTLHQNIYHAFESRNKEEIYDTLSKSSDGEALIQIYQEFYLHLWKKQTKNQYGFINKVIVDDCKADIANNKILATLSWQSEGFVVHRGHIHPRKNQYRAKYTIAASGDSWKIQALEILQTLQIKDESAEEDEND